MIQSQPLITVLFAYVEDFKLFNTHHDPYRIIECLNKIIETFDRVTDYYDVYKIETKAEASYMIVAGLTDRSHLNSYQLSGSLVR